MDGDELRNQSDQRKLLKSLYESLFADIRSVLNRYDPIGLIGIGAPDDEYEPEVGTILPRLRPAGSPEHVRVIVDQEFEHWFGSEVVGCWRASRETGEEIWQAWQQFVSTPGESK